MLRKILIKNIALIPELEIELFEGLNVLSGETGAGKSIIIDSLNLVLGTKTDKSLVRHGEERALVEAVFDTPSEAEPILSELGIEYDDILVITRTLSREGKSESRLNGRLLSLSMLKKITALLVDIHGQHEHQAILKPANHLSIIDGFNPKIFHLKTECARLYADYKKLGRELKSLGGSDEDRARLADMLSYQIEEIKNADISEDEYEELRAQRHRLLNLSKISNAVASALEQLTMFSLPQQLSLAASSLNSVLEFEPTAEALVERLRSARIETADIIDEVESIASSLEFDEDEADRIEARLNLYKSLFRKYGGTVGAVEQFLEKSELEYEKLIHSAEHIERIKSAIKKTEKELYDICTTLTEMRSETATRLTSQITEEMRELGINPTVEARFTEYTKETFSNTVTSDGADSVEFYFSANKGEPVKPLVKVISGGEMSRFMLALKSIIADTDNMPTMVFDEIDTGISGKIGQAVAVKLGKIAKNHQVICVTHLAQIASMADSHYLIAKFETDTKTFTEIKRLDEKGELEEIARLSGGKDISGLSIEHAAELKQWSKNIKSN